MKIIFLLFLASCSLLAEQKQLVSEVSSSWKGQNIEALSTHLYFQTLNFKDITDSPEVFKRTYYRRAKFTGGGVFQESGDCYHVFRIKNNRIDKYRQQGNCREDNQFMERLLFSRSIE